MDTWYALLALAAWVMPLLLAWALLAWRDRYPRTPAARSGGRRSQDH